jgi:type III restriction enzyme
MKLQFKHQRFQEDAAKAVVDVFAGQPYLTLSYDSLSTILLSLQRLTGLLLIIPSI